ncbi:MAG: thiamine phosphate synthase [Proteobacteria bacterium]|nr:thiamine phosphate synthase [Pseudomonadota bacterium]
MSSPAIIKGLYAIVDDSFGDSVGLAENILAGGCRLLQLRSKQMSTARFLDAARKIKTICRKRGATFIINDRIDIALAAGADGVHLGQDDLSLNEAKKIMGNKIIGISTHNLSEAEEAEKRGAHYIGFGPIFRTNTKADAHAVQGLDKLSKIRQKVSIPIVAIGGITGENMQSAYLAGADAVAIISYLAKAKNVCERTKELMNIKGVSHDRD